MHGNSRDETRCGVSEQKQKRNENETEIFKLFIIYLKRINYLFILDTVDL